MKVTKKVFGEIAKNRQENLEIYGVYGVKKDGSLYKTPSTTAKTEEEANMVKERMEGYNPGHRYMVKKI